MAVPGQGFFRANLSSNEVSTGSCSYQKRYIRFAFCKSDGTLAAVSERLGKLLDAAGHLALHQMAERVKDDGNQEQLKLQETNFVPINKAYISI